MQIITLTTDWGTRDHYSGSVKGSILSRLPEARIVDITHRIAVFDILQASFIIRNCFRDFPRGSIHIISVNSQLEMELNHLVMEFEGHYFIGPDVGVFSMIRDDGPARFVKIAIGPDVSDAQLNFPTRYLFVNAACHLAKGGELEDLGDLTTQVVEKHMLRPTVEGETIKGSIQYVDVYGNVITNISRSFFEEVVMEKPFIIYLRKNDYDIDRISLFYNDVPHGEKLALFNSSGYLEIAINTGSATGLLNLKVNDGIKIIFGDHENR
jgi:S-adenosylmethionine hydrolase